MVKHKCPFPVSDPVSISIVTSYAHSHTTNKAKRPTHIQVLVPNIVLAVYMFFMYLVLPETDRYSLVHQSTPRTAAPYARTAIKPAVHRPLVSIHACNT